MPIPNATSLSQIVLPGNVFSFQGGQGGRSASLWHQEVDMPLFNLARRLEQRVLVSSATMRFVAALEPT